MARVNKYEDGLAGWAMDRRNDPQEIHPQDRIIWARPINAPRSVPWRPVSGERGQYATSMAEAARVLRAEGYSVTRRRSGL